MSNIDLDRLIAAAHRLTLRISPTFDPTTGTVLVSAEDVRSIMLRVRQIDGAFSETNAMAELLGARHGRFEDRRLSNAQVLRAAAVLGRVQAAVDRADKIRRGQFTGPMSPREAAAFARARFGRR